MRATLFSLLVLTLAGCMPESNGSRGAATMTAGPTGLVVDFGWGQAPNGAPACGWAFNDPPACFDGSDPVTWLAYQDGSGLGCAAHPDDAGNAAVSDPSRPPSEQRWGLATMCGQMDAACLCADGARCELPALDPSLHSVLRYYDEAAPRDRFSRRDAARGVVAVGIGCAHLQAAEADYVPRVELYDLGSGDVVGWRCYGQSGPRCCEHDQECLRAEAQR